MNVRLNGGPFDGDVVDYVTAADMHCVRAEAPRLSDELMAEDLRANLDGNVLSPTRIAALIQKQMRWHRYDRSGIDVMTYAGQCSGPSGELI